MAKPKPATKFVVTIKVTLEDPSVDYTVALAYKARIAELAGDLAPGQSGAVGSSIEDWAQLRAKHATLKDKIEWAIAYNHSASAARIPAQQAAAWKVLQELGYVPQA